MFVFHRAKSYFLWVSSFLIVFFCLRALRLIGQFSVLNDWRRRHTSNTSSYSIQSKGKQLSIFFAIANIRETISGDPFLFSLVIPWCVQKVLD